MNPYVPTFVWWKISTVKFPHGENSLWRNFLTANISYGENSVRRKLRMAKNPTAKTPTEKNSTTKIPSAGFQPFTIWDCAISLELLQCIKIWRTYIYHNIVFKQVIIHQVNPPFHSKNLKHTMQTPCKRILEKFRKCRYMYRWRHLSTLTYIKL